MKSSFEEALIDVWRQALVENSKVTVGANDTGWQEKVMLFLSEGRYVANVVDGTDPPRITVLSTDRDLEDALIAVSDLDSRECYSGPSALSGDVHDKASFTASSKNVGFL